MFYPSNGESITKTILASSLSRLALSQVVVSLTKLSKVDAICLMLLTEAELESDLHNFLETFGFSRFFFLRVQSFARVGFLDGA